MAHFQIIQVKFTVNNIWKYPSSLCPSVPVCNSPLTKTQQEGRRDVISFYWPTRLMRARPPLWQQASVRRWRPPGREEGTTWPSFIDIPCRALPSAAPSRSVCEPLRGGGWDRVMDDTRLSAKRDSTAGPLNDRRGPAQAHTCPSRARRATSRGEKGDAATFDGQMFWRGGGGDSCTAGTPQLLSGNWKSCKRSIAWYWPSLSASCSFQPEHDKNNTDWMTASAAITAHLAMDVHVMTRSVNIPRE